MNEFIRLSIALIFVWLLSSCHVIKSLKSTENKKDSVSQTSQGSVRVDSNGTKSDKTYTKETFYLPGKDTIINNIIQAGKPQIVYIKETGQEKTEQAQIIRDTSWKDAFNSLAVLIANKETESKTRVGLGFWEIFAIAIVGLIFIFLVANKFITLKK